MGEAGTEHRESRENSGIIREGKPVSLREFRPGEKVRGARMLAWTLECVTGRYLVLGRACLKLESAKAFF